MTDERFAEVVAGIVRENPKFAPDAYYFVSAALRRAVDKAREEGGAPKHVSGQEVIYAAKELAISEFGPMGAEVMRHWGVDNTLDIGTIVFNMVRSGLLGVSERDSIEDFRDVFDLHKELAAPFLPTKRTRRKRKLVAIDDEIRMPEAHKVPRNGDNPS